MLSALALLAPWRVCNIDQVRTGVVKNLVNLPSHDDRHFFNKSLTVKRLSDLPWTLTEVEEVAMSLDLYRGNVSTGPREQT